MSLRTITIRMWACELTWLHLQSVGHTKHNFTLCAHVFTQITLYRLSSQEHVRFQLNYNSGYELHSRLRFPSFSTQCNIDSTSNRQEGHTALTFYRFIFTIDPFDRELFEMFQSVSDWLFANNNVICGNYNLLKRRRTCTCVNP